MSEPNNSQLYLLVYENYEDESRKSPIRYMVSASGATLGRDFQCEVLLHSNTVSAKHARIEFDTEAKQWKITDLHSKNGIVRNGERTLSHVLANGDRIQLGETLFITQIRAGDLEETRTFIIAPDRKAAPSMKSIAQVSASLGLFLVLHFQMEFHPTLKSAQEELWSFFVIWLLMWCFSMAWSFQIRKKPYPVYYGFFQLKAFVYFGILSAVYPVLAMSFLRPSWDNVISFIILSGLGTFYLYRLILSYQKKISSRKAVAFALIVVVGVFGIKKVSSHFMGETLMRPRLAYSLFLPSKKHDTGELITALDQVFDKVKETNLDE